MRHVLAEAALVAVRKEPYRTDYIATKRRRGSGIALVRTSRKLLAQAFYVLSELKDD